MTDANEIIHALRLWFQAGDVFEVRVLDAVSADWMRPHTESGYFDYEHIPDAAAAIGKLRAYRGAYATVNPVKPELLARAWNRIRPVLKEPTTADSEVLARRWLLIDCDPKRASGVSSTKAEHESALAKARKIRSDLFSLGWPDPIMTDSGNGAQLMYRIDLPATDGGLVQKCTNAFARASDDAVSIDTSVHNPARIWRIPGTMNCKGDSIPERPHRMAKLLEAPDNLQAVSEAQLLDVAAWDDTDSGYLGNTAVTSDFKLDSWIAQYCPELGSPQPWKGGRKWIFPVCPFNEAHTNKSAVLIQEPSGAVAFKCHHNGCSGNDWRALRELREPGCCERHESTLPDVDISGILSQKPKNIPFVEIAEPVESSEPSWRKLGDGDVLKAIDGTLFGRLCRYFCSVSEPALPIAVGIAKSLTLCGAALSRPRSASPSAMAKMRAQGNIAGQIGIGPLLGLNMIDTGGGQIPNFYSILVAPSSSGKDIGGLLEQLAVRHNWYIGDAGSAEGLADAFIKMPNGILSISELQPWLDVKCWQHNAVPFLTKSFNKGFFKSSFSSRGGHGNIRAADYCYPNILACVQPDVLRKIADKSDLENGFLGRFLFARMVHVLCQPNSFDLQKTLDEMSLLLEAFKRKEGVIHIEKGYSASLGKMFSKNAPEEIDFTWKRLINEYYPRFAFLLSLTDDPATQRCETELKNTDWERAEQLVLWFFANAERLLLNIEDRNVDSRIRTRETLLEKVCRKIQRLDKGNGVTIRDISISGIRNSNAKERREAIAELTDRGIIVSLGDGRYKIDHCPPEWSDC